MALSCNILELFDFEQCHGLQRSLTVIANNTIRYIAQYSIVIMPHYAFILYRF